MALDKLIDSAALDATFQEIAGAIREKNGETSLYAPEQMAQAILAIAAGGGRLQMARGTMTPTNTDSSSTIITGLPNPWRHYPIHTGLNSVAFFVIIGNSQVSPKCCVPMAYYIQGTEYRFYYNANSSTAAAPYSLTKQSDMDTWIAVSGGDITLKFNYYSAYGSSGGYGPQTNAVYNWFAFGE